MPKDIVIDVQNLTKVYKIFDKPKDRLKESLNPFGKRYSRDFYALKDVSFKIKKGECIGFIGKNGAGKSTLLKVLTGVLTPTGGQVSVVGKVAALLELGGGFNPEFTGIENIYLNGMVMGYTKEEMDKRVESIISFADIGDFINQPVKMYSSGMFARLAFAVSINVEPDILIVDEALSVGDIFFQAKCYKKFNELKEKGTTILFVTHSLGIIVEYCDSAMVLDNGQKIAEGNPKDMVDLYKKILVNEDVSLLPEETQQATSGIEVSFDNNNINWKEKLILNPKVSIYGNNLGNIIDFAILDRKGNITNIIDKGQEFSVRIKAAFYADLQDPIFAFTILNSQGVDICGTNTMLEKKGYLEVKKGDIKTVTFSQKMNLQGGEYLLSLGLTGYRDGDFVVYQRLYDVCNITVLSEKNTVGFFDMNSKVTLE